MTLVSLAVVLGILGGFVFRGRPSTFSRPTIRHFGLLLFVMVALPTSLIAKFPGVAGGWVIAAGLALLWFWATNRGRPGLGLAIAGLALNAAVILANAGMPVSLAAAERAAVPPERIALEEDPLREELTDDTTLPWLSEALPLALPLRPSVASVGDVLIAAGSALFFFTGLTGFGRDVPKRQRTPKEIKQLRRERRAAKAADQDSDESDQIRSADDGLAVVGAASADRGTEDRAEHGRSSRGRAQSATGALDLAAEPVPVPSEPVPVDRAAYGYAGSAIPPTQPAEAADEDAGHDEPHPEGGPDEPGSGDDLDLQPTGDVASEPVADESASERSDDTSPTDESDSINSDRTDVADESTETERSRRQHQRERNRQRQRNRASAAPAPDVDAEGPDVAGAVGATAVEWRDAQLAAASQGRDRDPSDEPATSADELSESSAADHEVDDDLPPTAVSDEAAPVEVSRDVVEVSRDVAEVSTDVAETTEDDRADPTPPESPASDESPDELAKPAEPIEPVLTSVAARPQASSASAPASRASTGTPSRRWFGLRSGKHARRH